MSQRLTRFLDGQKTAGRKTFVTFLMAHYPTPEHFTAALKQLPESGADIIEIGMPFSDPMADGPVIQMAGATAIKNGASISAILEAVRRFREHNSTTPLILMGYYNPVFHYGVERFGADAAAAGLDGAIIVDVPLEERDQIAPYFHSAGLSLINLITPSTDAERISRIAASATGFLYGVAVAGITGTKQGEEHTVTRMVKEVRSKTPLPLMIGFGIKTPEQAAHMASLADGAVVGSALIEQMTAAWQKGETAPALAASLDQWVRPMADAVHGASTPASLRKAQGG